MASHIGLIFRNEQAQARVDTALAAILATGKVDVPSLPRKTRDARENETLRLEWLAEALEAVEAATQPKPKPKAKGNAS